MIETCQSSNIHDGQSSIDNQACCSGFSDDEIQSINTCTSINLLESVREGITCNKRSSSRSVSLLLKTMF